MENHAEPAVIDISILYLFPTAYLLWTYFLPCKIWKHQKIINNNNRLVFFVSFATLKIKWNSLNYSVKQTGVLQERHDIKHDQL